MPWLQEGGNETDYVALLFRYGIISSLLCIDTVRFGKKFSSPQLPTISRCITIAHHAYTGLHYTKPHLQD
jgi:hypothetical protein